MMMVMMMMMMMMMVAVEEFVVCAVEFIGSDRVKQHREGVDFRFS